MIDTPDFTVYDVFSTHFAFPMHVSIGLMVAPFIVAGLRLFAMSPLSDRFGSRVRSVLRLPPLKPRKEQKYPRLHKALRRSQLVTPFALSALAFGLVHSARLEGDDVTSEAAESFAETIQEAQKKAQLPNEVEWVEVDPWQLERRLFGLLDFGFGPVLYRLKEGRDLPGDRSVEQVAIIHIDGDPLATLCGYNEGKLDQINLSVVIPVIKERTPDLFDKVSAICPSDIPSNPQTILAATSMESMFRSKLGSSESEELKIAAVEGGEMAQ